MARTKGHAAWPHHDIRKVHQVMAHVGVEAKIDVVRKDARRSGAGSSEEIRDPGTGRHDGVVASTFLFLVNLVKAMSRFVAGAAHEGPRNLTLLLVCGGSKVGRIAGWISVIAETGHAFARRSDGVVHH